MYRIIFFIFFFVFFNSRITAQTSPPEPCTFGSQNTCHCETSPILCTNVLDNYEYDMTNYRHELDGPDNPMCMPGGTNTTAHNPTWFRFIALCEDLQMTVTTTNCNYGGQSGCDSRGVQLAVFPECDWQNPWDAVACNVNQCRNSAPWSQTINLSMTGLTVGKLYSLVVDGCCNSACHVHINITTPPCFPDIQDWQREIQGPKDVCVGDNATYCVENVTGGLNYIWTLDGVLVDAGPADDSGITCMTNRLVFSQKGTYTLCVDTENVCVPITDNPPPNCITITVHDAEAGTITANPTPTCPGNNVNINVTGNASDAGLSQYIVIVDASGTVVQVTPGTTGSFTWSECAAFTAYSYNYVTVQQPVPQVGDNLATVTDGCSQDYKCCDFDSVDIVFEDNEEPVFLNVPVDITVDCYESIPVMTDLSFTDNCMSGGTVAGVQTEAYTDCSGGAINRIWTVVDSCGNKAISTQTITIDPIPVATFTPFDDVTISCEMFPVATFLPPLSYSNGSTGNCLVAGTIIPYQIVDTSACEGTVTFVWHALDKCGRVLNYQQVWTVGSPYNDIDTTNMDQHAVWYSSSFIGKFPEGDCRVELVVTRVMRDTLIGDTLARIIGVTRGGVYYKESEVPFFEKDGRLYFFEEDAWRLLYDYTAQAGDTVDYYVSKKSPYYYMIEKIDPDQSNPAILYEDQYWIKAIDTIYTEEGKALKRFDTRHATDVNKMGYIIERMGSMNHLFGLTNVPVPYGCPAHSTAAMRCYADKEIHLKFTEEDCDMISATDNADEVFITMRPNPAIDKLEIHFPSESAFKGRISIVTMEGNMVRTDSITPGNCHVLEINYLASGMYFLQIVSEKGNVVTKRFVKI